MVKGSRTGKSIHNSVVALGYYVVGLLLSFFSRKIFLDCLGTEILGLNTTAQNLLQFLNLAELGIGTAVGFSLYKPLREQDTETINEIVALQGHLYKRIGLFILIGACILMAFFPLIFKKMELPLWYAFASFGVLLFSALLGYFVNYKQVLLTSNQQNYKVQNSFTSVNLIKVLAQMGAVYWLPDGYVWWLVLEAVFALIASISLHRATVKEFPTLKNVRLPYGELKNKYLFIVTKIKQLFFHKIAGFALSQSSPLIIYALIDLSLVAIYGNYLIILTGIQKIVFAMFNGMDAGVGNLVAEGDEKKIRKVFLELFSIRFVIAATLTVTFLCLTSPFIRIWVGEEYILPFSTLCLITASLFIAISRYTVDTFINAYGLYGDIWAPVAETVLNIGLSVLFGIFWGLNGIILGVIVSQFIIVLCWKPFYLTLRKMTGFLHVYIREYAVHIVCGAAIGAGFFFMVNECVDVETINFMELICYGFFIMGGYALMLAGALAFLSTGMKGGLKRIIGIVNRKRRTT